MRHSVFLLVVSLAALVAGIAFAPRVLAPRVLADEPQADSKDAQKKPAPAPLDADHAARMAAGLDLFKKHVRPILVGRCVRCHGGEDTLSVFELATREALLRGGEEGTVVVPGKPAESRLVRLIKHEEEPSMPEDGAKLSDIAIQHIVDWIELGAPYDGSLIAEEEDPLAWTARQIDDSRRDFWSFQPLAKLTPPDVGDDAWVRTDIDRFVLAALRERGLTPNQPAERRKLIRRAAFDLTGLPPSPEDVEAFVNDPDPRAYEKLIDRLLESPHYGERWGRHWLDLARFAESHGFEQDYDRPHAYHFRDFVIRALNRDMPFDQFVRWQLAGDRLAPDDPLAWMATGFLGAGVFPTQLTEKEFEPARYDELDDMIATTGTSMLGLTIGCARCHDHKFDPIPSADYYRLISTFTKAIRGNIELELDPERTRDELAAWEDEHAPLVAALKTYEREELPGSFKRWLAEQGDKPSAGALDGWIVLDVNEPKSKGGATFARLEDGSLRVSGTNADFDTYTFTIDTQLTGITSIRLEALADEGLVKNGPGRASNGNFGLGDFRVMAEPLDGSREAVPVKLVNPRVDFEQNTGNLSIAASIDDDPKTGWAVDPQFGKDHAAVFDTAEPIGFPDGTKLTFALDFQVNKQHAIGRPRLAVSTAKPPVAADAPSQSQAVVELLAAVQRGERAQDDAERTKLLEWYRKLDPQWVALRQRVDEHLGKKPQPQLTQVMVVSEGIKPIPHHADGRGFPHFYPETFFLNRGDTQQKQGQATPGFLQVLTPSDAAHEAAPSASGESAADQPRVALAAWITDTDGGAGDLLARVIVNRLWLHHFSRGIVSTPNDFGFQGARPTHPELLDWLAQRLIADGWRLKPLHKLMMTSAVYMQDSQESAANEAIDPDNEWLWKYEPQRLEAEIIRDAMLAVSGQLDRTQFGPGSLDEAMKRRSIYFMIKRSKLVPMMQIFDAPEPLVGVGRRPSTTIAPQALMFMNNPNVRGYAQAFAQRVLDATASADNASAASQAIEYAYQLALSRPPSPAELEDGVAFLETQTASYEADGQAGARQLAMADFCQVLMSLNEFVYVD